MSHVYRAEKNQRNANAKNRNKYSITYTISVLKTLYIVVNTES